MDPEFPLVSVVTAYFNEGPLLLRAIDSALDQDYPGAIEVVVVDDCSTIPVPEIPAIYRDRVRILRTPHNSYAGAARNLGVQNARGQYLCFLDADDVFLPNRIASHMGMARQHPDLVVIGSPILIRRGGNEWTEFPSNFIRIIPNFTIESQLLPEDTAWHICDDYNFTTGSITVLRDAFLQAGGFDESLRWGEEWELLIRLVESGPMGYVAEAGCRYIQRTNSITSTINPWKFDSMARINRQVRQKSGIPSDIAYRARLREREAWLLACQEFLERQNNPVEALRCALEAWKTGPSIWAARSTLRAYLWKLLRRNPTPQFHKI